MKTRLYKLRVMVFLILVTAGCERAAKHDQASQGDQQGPPKDWKFTLAQGDAAEGRNVFVELQCYKCHEVKGESFPDLAPGDKGIGPELSQMAGLNPAEFFAESIINPNAVIDADAKEQGHVGADGKSKMPDYSDTVTVRQLTDLSAYLKSLRGDGPKTQ